MDIFAALEDRIARLIKAYRTLAARVVELEEENRKLSAAGSDREQLAGKVAELERERAELRARLEKLLEQLAAVEV